jgi:hypothetical protein
MSPLLGPGVPRFSSGSLRMSKSASHKIFVPYAMGPSVDIQPSQASLYCGGSVTVTTGLIDSRPSGALDLSRRVWATFTREGGFP